MAALLFTVVSSLDGYTADADGNFDWAAPDDEVHAFVNDLERAVGTYLCGRRLWEVMRYWENAHLLPDRPAVEREYTQMWQAADKIVYSTTLSTTSIATTERTELRRTIDVQDILNLKARAGQDISVGGPTLAAQALAAGLVDEIRLFLVPVTVGGGTPVLPEHMRLGLELIELRRFTSGVAYLRYRVTH